MQRGIRLRPDGVPAAAVLRRGEDMLRHLVPFAVVNAPLDRTAEVGEPVGELGSARDAQPGRTGVGGGMR